MQPVAPSEFLRARLLQFSLESLGCPPCLSKSAWALEDYFRTILSDEDHARSVCVFGRGLAAGDEADPIQLWCDGTEQVPETPAVRRANHDLHCRSFAHGRGTHEDLSVPLPIWPSEIGLRCGYRTSRQVEQHCARIRV